MHNRDEAPLAESTLTYSRQTVEVVREAPEKPASRTSAQLNDHTDCGIGGRQYASSELIETP